MGVVHRLKIGFGMARRSSRVLRAHPKLLVFPLVGGLSGVAWSVMTYFAVPVVVFRDPSIADMLEESARTFKNTWGESIGAMGTIDVVTFLLALGGVAVAAVTFVLTAGLGPGQLLATAVVGGSVVLVALLVGKALTGVAKTALYVYATENTASEHFEDMDFGALGGESVSGGRLTGTGGRI